MSVTEQMKQAGNEIASYLIDATIEKVVTHAFNIKKYEDKYQQLILDYLDEKIDSVTAIYIAMNNERETYYE